MAERFITRIVAAALAAAIAALAAPANAESPLPLRWQADHPGGATDAVAAGGRLFVAGADVLRAYDASTGRVLWEAPASPASSLCADRGSVWAAGGGALRRLAADSGRTLGQIQLNDPAVLAPEPIKGRLLVEAAGETAILDARSLAAVARVPCPLFHDCAALARQTGQWRARLDESGGRAFFLLDGQLRTIALADGRVVRADPTPPRAVDWPTFRRGRVYFVSPHRLNCRDAKRGGSIWERRIVASRVLDPLMLVSGMTAPGRRNLSWPQRLWIWLTALPSVFHQNRLTAHADLGLLYQFTNHDDREPLLQPLPDEVMPLADVGWSVYYLCTYRDGRADQTKSVVQRWHKRSAQLYGRSPTLGRATGFFAFGLGRLYAEMAPGRLVEMDLDELRPRRFWQAPDEGLAAMPDDGGILFAVSRAGRIAAIRLE